MKIIRDNKEIELTDDELAMAYREFITDKYMKDYVKDLTDDLELSEEQIDDLADDSYCLYIENDYLSEFECVEEIVGKYREDNNL